ncbi:uncharacterized protein LOC103171699 [Callorhinchus milii]|uniref:uncharacterized protein LOC103171699 n=1 Tax=Callorhinchus milii TaxID=7868 RepID=UPI001C3F7C4D|nr:uncharacterized protein LOC103171699 [Callorhinchus milii]
MASASHSVGEPRTGTGTAQVRSAAARAVRAVPGARAEPPHTRYAGFKQQIRHVLGWKKILNQQMPSPGGEAAYGGQSHTHRPGPDQRVGSKQSDQSLGSEHSKPLAPSQGSASDTCVQPAPGHRAGPEQKSRPGLDQSSGPGTDSQPALDPVSASEHSYQPVLVREKGTELGSQALPDENGESEHSGQPTRDQGMESQANNQAALDQRPVLGASNQPVLEQSIGSVKQYRFLISGNAGSLKQFPPVRSKLVQEVNLESEQQVPHIVDPNTEPEQQSPSVQTQDLRSKQHNWLRDVKSVQHIPPSMGGNKRSQQRIQPFKYHFRPVLAHSTGLEHQIFFTLTRNLGYISDLYNSVNLIQENQQPGPGDGSYISPGKRDSVRWPVVRKRAKSCPGSPERKTKRGNRVRFADSLGLELAVVRSYSLADEPEIPAHVLSSLGGRSNDDNKVWVQSFKPSFPAPMEAANFLERLRKQQVCLERVSESDLIISGTILVLNMAFEKDVTVRYTCTNWNLFSDVPALFDKSLGNNTDRFTFTLSPSVYMLEPGSCLEFAIRYSVNGVHFWDNNNDINYKMIYNIYRVSESVSNSQSTSASFV